jgi:pentose-5-phosphate-3-epimerase
MVAGSAIFNDQNTIAANIEQLRTALYDIA